MEKSFAKLNQNYERIIGGLPRESLRFLTGMPTRSWFHRDWRGKMDYIQKMYKFFADRNFPMTASCCENGSWKGLVDGHAYTFLDVQELKDSSGNVKHTIAKLRNPWGSEKYKGPFSDGDSAWTEEWKQQVNLK